MELVPPFVPPLVDHTRYFRHAPARLRVAANMFALACGYAAICLLRPLCPLKAIRGLGVGLGWLYMATGAPLLLTRQLLVQSNRRSY